MLASSSLVDDSRPIPIVRFSKGRAAPHPDMSGGHLGTGTFGSLH